MVNPGCLRVSRRQEASGSGIPFNRQEHRTAARGPGTDRDEGAILAAAEPLDANHVGPEVGQECGAERACDVSPEIEDANAFQHTGQCRLLPFTVAYRFKLSRQLAKVGRCPRLRLSAR